MDKRSAMALRSLGISIAIYLVWVIFWAGVAYRIAYDAGMGELVRWVAAAGGFYLAHRIVLSLLDEVDDNDAVEIEVSDSDQADA